MAHFRGKEAETDTPAAANTSSNSWERISLLNIYILLYIYIYIHTLYNRKISPKKKFNRKLCFSIFF